MKTNGLTSNGLTVYNVCPKVLCAARFYLYINNLGVDAHRTYTHVMLILWFYTAVLTKIYVVTCYKYLGKLSYFLFQILEILCRGKLN